MLACWLQLIGQAEINANAADSKDHPEGVYSLPPTLRGSFINPRQRGRVQEAGRVIA